MENKPHFLSPGFGFTKEKVCYIGLGNERLLGDTSAEFPVPLVTRKAWQPDVERLRVCGDILWWYCTGG